MKDFKFLFTAVFLNFMFTLDSNLVIATSVLKHLVNYNQLNEQMMSYSPLNSSYSLPTFCCFSTVFWVSSILQLVHYFLFFSGSVSFSKCHIQFIFFLVFSLHCYVQFFSSSHRLLSFTNCMKYWFSVGYTLCISCTLRKTFKALSFLKTWTFLNLFICLESIL